MDTIEDLVTNKTTDELFLGQTCQNEEKVYGEETYLAEQKNNHMLRAEIPSCEMSRDPFRQNPLTWLQIQMIQLHRPMHVFGKRISDWFIHSYSMFYGK